MLIRNLVPMAAFFLLILGADHSLSSQIQDENGSDPYVLILAESDSSPEKLLQSYPEVTGSWEDLALYNLLRPGGHLELTRDMLSQQKVLAKMSKHYGETEVRRLFDKRFMPVVENLLLREGDVLRTWRKSGGRISFDDGIYIFVRSNSRLRLDTLGSKDSPSPLNVRIRLIEGSIWSRVDKNHKGRFEVETPSASTIIRGTDFRLKIEAGNATRLEVLDGNVELKAGEESISVGPQRGVVSLNGDIGNLQALPPAPGELLVPQPKEVFRSERFDAQFSWSPVTEAQSYRIEVAKDSNFLDLVEMRHIGAEPSVRIMDLEPGTYFWRVMSVNGDGFEGLPTEDSYFIYVRPKP